MSPAESKARSEAAWHGDRLRTRTGASALERLRRSGTETPRICAPLSFIGAASHVNSRGAEPNGPFVHGRSLTLRQVGRGVFSPASGAYAERRLHRAVEAITAGMAVRGEPALDRALFPGSKCAKRSRSRHGPKSRNSMVMRTWSGLGGELDRPEQLRSTDPPISDDRPHHSAYVPPFARVTVRVPVQVPSQTPPVAVKLPS